MIRLFQEPCHIDGWSFLSLISCNLFHGCFIFLFIFHLSASRYSKHFIRMSSSLPVKKSIMNTFKQIPKRMGRIYSHPSGLFQNSFISYIFFHHSLLSLSESVYNSLQALHFLISGYLFPFKYFLIFRMAFFTKVPILRMKFSSFPENRSRIYPFRQITRRAESA